MDTAAEVSATPVLEEAQEEKEKTGGSACAHGVFTDVRQLQNM